MRECLGLYHALKYSAPKGDEGRPSNLGRVANPVLVLTGTASFCNFKYRLPLSSSCQRYHVPKEATVLLNHHHHHIIITILELQSHQTQSLSRKRSGETNSIQPLRYLAVTNIYVPVLLKVLFTVVITFKGDGNENIVLVILSH